MYNAEVREKVGDLHLMNPTNFFSCGGVHDFNAFYLKDRKLVFMKVRNYPFLEDKKIPSREIAPLPGKYFFR